MSSDHINVSMTFTAFAMNMPPKTSFSSEIGMSIKGILNDKPRACFSQYVQMTSIFCKINCCAIISAFEDDGNTPASWTCRNRRWTTAPESASFISFPCHTNGTRQTVNNKVNRTNLLSLDALLSPTVRTYMVRMRDIHLIMDSDNSAYVVFEQLAEVALANDSGWPPPSFSWSSIRQELSSMSLSWSSSSS